MKLITKGKAISVNRALQKLYSLEVCSMTRECESEINGLSKNPVGNEGNQMPSGRGIALDSCWKTQAMLDH